MCGIIGVLSDSNVSKRLIGGLRRLEYRGYDSAGIATINEGKIDRRRAKGKIIFLEKKIIDSPIVGNIGIGHTRWATHGVPNEENAHPHATSKVAVVHNGIIENFKTLREELISIGCNFESDTDSEAIVHLISNYLDKGLTPQASVAQTLKKLHGAFALAIIFSHENDLLIGARKGSPLAVGWGNGEMFLGSDSLALSGETSEITYLEEGDWVELNSKGAIFYDKDDKEVDRDKTHTELSQKSVSKGNYSHFMLKEIFEQPTVIGETLNGFFNPADQILELPDLGINLKNINNITIVACGTSFFAGLTAKYWIEKYSRIPVDVDIASEFRYRESDLPNKGLALFISQSGETADTIAALKYAKSKNQHIVSLVNVSDSSMARMSDGILLTKAGPEIGVASTKAFTCQLVSLAVLSIALATAKEKIEISEINNLSKAISEIPSRAADILNYNEEIKSISLDIVKAKDILYIGRGTEYPIALEGALKLKELSYIHAEGFPAGELKHGPIALVDDSVPIIVLAPSGPLFNKTISNMEEIIARGGKVILISDAKGCNQVGEKVLKKIQLPSVNSFVTPILYSIPIQLLAYYVALAKGTDVDQPRNLAKSVTVE